MASPCGRAPATFGYVTIHDAHLTIHPLQQLEVEALRVELDKVTAWWLAGLTAPPEEPSDDDGVHES